MAVKKTKSAIPANLNVRIANLTKHDIELPYVQGMSVDPKKRLLASKLDRGIVGRPPVEMTVKGDVLNRLRDNLIFITLVERGEIDASRGII
jgi:hypothetical protein